MTYLGFVTFQMNSVQERMFETFQSVCERFRTSLATLVPREPLTAGCDNALTSIRISLSNQRPGSWPLADLAADV